MIQTVFCIIFRKISNFFFLHAQSWHTSETASYALLEMSRTWMEQGAALIGKLSGLLLCDLWLFSDEISARWSTRRLLQNQPRSYSQVTSSPKRKPWVSILRTPTDVKKGFTPGRWWKILFYWKIDEVLHETRWWGCVCVCASGANISCTRIWKGPCSCGFTVWLMAIPY